jgi:peroxiredoxin
MSDTRSGPNFFSVDWSTIPAPVDDGAANHLVGATVPAVQLSATDGTTVDLSELQGRTVIYAYPMTGLPGTALPDGWDGIPGARGCTPQSCAFRDHHADLVAAGAAAVYGLSSQDTAYQREAAERLHLPFQLLSDERLALAKGLGLPVFIVDGRTLLKRLALIIDSGRIVKVFYPVFPPDTNAADVLAWLREHPV